MAQLIGLVSIWAFVAVFAGLTFFILKHTIGIRVPKEVEMLGLDIHEHGMRAYPEDATYSAQ